MWCIHIPEWVEPGQIKDTASTDRSTVECPVDETNSSASSLANMIDLKVPGKIITNPDSQEFSRRNPLNWLIVEIQSHVRKGVLLGSDNHGFGLAALAVS